MLPRIRPCLMEIDHLADTADIFIMHTSSAAAMLSRHVTAEM
jgi:hypothetical protein